MEKDTVNKLNFLRSFLDKVNVINFEVSLYFINNHLEIKNFKMFYDTPKYLYE